MKAIIVNPRLRGKELDVEDPLHFVAEWPNAKCGKDLTGRPRRNVDEVIQAGEPVCAECVMAYNRECSPRQVDQA